MDKKVLFIGLDGSTFDLLDPLMKKGIMPRLSRFIDIQFLPRDMTHKPLGTLDLTSNKFITPVYGNSGDHRMHGIILGKGPGLRRHRAMIVQTLLLTLVMRAVWSLGFVAVARAMQLPLELPAIFAFVSLVDLIRMLPITPIGLREGAFVLLLASIGIGRKRAPMFSLLGFAPLLLMAVAGGVAYISRKMAGQSGLDPG